jgi:hypothetical protein
MRRPTLALPAVLLAVLAAACASGAPAPRSGDGSAAPNLFGQTFVMPTSQPTSDATVAPADVSSWFELAPIGQGFAVAVPEQPTTTSGSVGDPPAASTFWTYTDPSGRKFQIVRSRLPTGLLSDNSSAMLDRLDDTILESLDGGSFTARTEVTINGQPGIQYAARSGSLRSEGLLVLHEAILYRVSVTYQADRADEASVLGFLDSFTLMP